jgi:hypothetical protein
MSVTTGTTATTAAPAVIKSPRRQAGGQYPYAGGQGGDRSVTLASWAARAGGGVSHLRGGSLIRMSI